MPRLYSNLSSSWSLRNPLETAIWICPRFDSDYIDLLLNNVLSLIVIRITAD